MKEDKEDNHRVRRWRVEKGSEEDNDDAKQRKKAMDESGNMQVDGSPSQGGRNNPSSGRVSSSSRIKRQNELVEEVEPKRNRMDGVNKRSESESAGSVEDASRARC